MESGNQYMLIIICMLTNHVFMIPIKTKTTEDVINTYLKDIYATCGGSLNISLMMGKSIFQQTIHLISKS